jgi:sterol desaturase/sphingolipid hydroxylase (fatty acid hydroxylase superfamily)
MKFLGALHGAPLRIAMEIVAIAGSAVNLFAVRRVRKLRQRPAAQWRMKSATPKQLRSESWQIGLAVLTLLLVAVEWGIHIYLHGSI